MSASASEWPFGSLPRGQAGLIYADPPWHFERYSEEYSEASVGRAPQDHYDTMTPEEMKALPVADLCAPDAVCVMWATAPHLKMAFSLMDAWGFEYKSLAFMWLKADVSTLDMFGGSIEVDMGMGYWMRANGELALLGTRGHPKRVDAGVRMGIIEPAREHSRKPDLCYDRLERLMGDVPKIELFSRTTRPGWLSFGNHAGRWESK